MAGMYVTANLTDEELVAQLRANRLAEFLLTTEDEKDDELWTHYVDATFELQQALVARGWTREQIITAQG